MKQSLLRIGTALVVGLAVAAAAGAAPASPEAFMKNMGMPGSIESEIEGQVQAAVDSYNP